MEEHGRTQKAHVKIQVMPYKFIPKCETST